MQTCLLYLVIDRVSVISKDLPSKHLLVFKTSSTRLQRNNFTSSKTSWRRLEDVLEDEKLLRWRRLEDVLKTCLEDVLKTCLEDVLKTYLEDVLKTSWRRLEPKQNFYWWYLYLTNQNVYLTNLCFKNLYLTNLWRIQNASLRTR